MLLRKSCMAMGNIRVIAKVKDAISKRLAVRVCGIIKITFAIDLLKTRKNISSYIAFIFVFCYSISRRAISSAGRAPDF